MSQNSAGQTTVSERAELGRDMLAEASNNDELTVTLLFPRVNS